jgi:glutaconate CoA-transferase, subunit A
VQIEGSVVQDDLIARSSSHTIVTADEIIPVEETQRNPKATTFPGFFVDSVVHVPFGAHPTSCHGRYAADEDHIEVYKELGAEKYLAEYVHGRAAHEDYLELIGAAHIVQLLQNMRNHVV